MPLLLVLLLPSMARLLLLLLLLLLRLGLLLMMHLGMWPGPGLLVCGAGCGCCDYCCCWATDPLAGLAPAPEGCVCLLTPAGAPARWTLDRRRLWEWVGDASCGGW